MRKHNASSLNALNLLGYTLEKPTEDGWYFVIFEPGDYPKRIYLHVTEYGISWGWDEEDDPEMIESSVSDLDLVLYKKAT